MPLYINGFGWISEHGYGNSSNGYLFKNPEKKLVLPSSKEIFVKPNPHYRNYDTLSKIVTLTVELTFQDAKRHFSETKAPIGIIGYGENGSLFSDQTYWEDFLEYGKTNARGNLFIHTLPTSPLAQTAIYYHLTGPLFYSSGFEKEEIISIAEDMVASGEASAILLGTFDQACLFFYLTDNAQNAILPAFDWEPAQPEDELIQDMIQRVSDKK